MKSAILYVDLAIILIAAFNSMGSEKVAVPEFEFDVWGSPPSRRVYDLSAEPVVQRILFSIEEKGLSVEDIAVKIGTEKEQILKKLNELSEFGLARQDENLWLSCIPLYTEDEMRAAGKVGEKYAEKEVDILKRELPSIKNVFNESLLSKYFSWDDVSLIVVGALLADFCVVDRIPFMSEHYTEDLQLSLVSSSGKKWSYYGFQKLPKRYPSRRWRFYQNQLKKYSGGLSRFGYYSENRPSQPSRPEGWIRFEQGKILFALAEGPQTFESLKQQTRLKPDILKKALDLLLNTKPPAIVLQNEKYLSKIPVLCEQDFDLLVRECDRVAKIIFVNVVLPHHAERVAEGKTSGSRWPLPADTYVRDRALQILIDSGQIGKCQSPPVDWNFCVWGWKGFLRMHDEITNDIMPDPFLLTQISKEEDREIASLNNLKNRIFKGNSLVDISTPANAYLTWISAYANSDIETLKQVEKPSESIDLAYLENRTKRGWLDYISKVDIRRVPPVPSNPKDGDVSSVFTMHERGFEEAYVFFFYDKGWRYIGNTSRDGQWQTWAGEAAIKKLDLLKKQ